MALVKKLFESKVGFVESSTKAGLAFVESASKAGYLLLKAL